MLKYGLHLGGGERTLYSQAAQLRKVGVDCVQIFATSPLSNTTPSLSYGDTAAWEHLRDKIQVLIHSPYWVTMFDSKLVHAHARYLYKLNKYFASEGELLYVTHIGTPAVDSTPESRVEEMKRALTEFRDVAPNVKVCLENDSGYKTRVTASISELFAAANGVAGVCFDSEHAYAAGEDLSVINPWSFDVLHLNAIPKYVKHGGHLDRHSFSTLIGSKEEINHTLEFLHKGKNNEKVLPVIMERRDLSLAVKDIEYTKRIVEHGFTWEKSQDWGPDKVKDVLSIIQDN